MDIMQGIAWIQTNWSSIAQAIASVIGTASIIVRITPTLKDDHFMKRLVKFIGKFIALNNNISGVEQKKVNKK